MFGKSDSLIRLYPIAIIILLAVVAMALFQVNDPYGLKILLLLMCAIWSSSFSRQNFSYIDMIVLLWWGYDILLCWMGINAIASIYAIRTSTVCLLLYISLRNIGLVSGASRLYWRGLCLIVGITIVLSLGTFVIFKNAVIVAGFEELYSFRFLFKPLGYHTNAWATFLFLSVGVMALARQKRVIGYGMYLCLMGLTWCALLLSFSRGVFILAGFYGLGLLWGMCSTKERLGTIAVILLAVGMVTLGFPQETKTTLSLHKTVSQQQSTQGRVHATKAALEVFAENRWLGAGTGNYTLVVDRTLNQDSRQAYTSYAPNFMIRVLIEKGLVGVALYFVGGIGVGIYCYRRRQWNTGRIIGVSLFMVFLKEMTLCTLPDTPIGIVLVYIMLAGIQQQERLTASLNNVAYRKLRNGVLVLCVLCYIGCIVCFFKQQSENKRIELSWIALEKENYEEVIHLTQQMGEEVPLLINKATVYMSCFLKQKNNAWLIYAEQALKEADRKQPEDVHIDYLLAELALLQNNRNEAVCILQRLAALYPENALYQYKLYECLLFDNRDIEALVYLENAIRLMPRILQMESVKLFQVKKPIFNEHLIANLLRYQPTDKEPVSELARFGFIAYHFNQKEIAKSCLQRVVQKMPHFSTPWFLLGQIYAQENDNKEAELCKRRYKLLTWGAFAFSVDGVNEKVSEPISEEILLNKYIMKFKSWYLYNLHFNSTSL